MEDLSECLENIGFDEVSVFEDEDINSLEELKALDDDEITELLPIGSGSDYKLKQVRAVKNLLYYLNHLDRIQRPFVLDDVTFETLEEMKVMRGFEKEQKSRVAPYPPILDGTPPVIIATCYLGQTYGGSGVPLTYVVRKQEDPDPDAVYTNVYEEMIARAPLTGFHFERDNEKVWYILLGLYARDKAKEVICKETFKAAKDGRGAYLALCEYFAIALLV
jgi:hypothetical protein